MQAPIRTALLAILATIICTGCSIVRAPSVEHIGVREIERSESRAVLGFRFRATNPNEDPIPLAEIRYTIDMNGDRVFEGVRSPQLTLDTYDEREFEIPAVIDTNTIDYSGTIDYTINGWVSFKRPARFAQELYRSRVYIPKVDLGARGAVNVDAP